MRNNLEKIKMLRTIILFCLFFFLNTVSAFAENMDLSWDSNTESDLAGYKVYYGSSSGNYGIPIDIGNRTTYTLTGLDLGTYYFSVTAYDTSGNESGFSNEVSKTILTSSTSATGEPSQFEASGGGGGGGCGVIHPGKDHSPGPGDSAEMIAMFSLLLLILLNKGLKKLPTEYRTLRMMFIK